MPIFQWSYISLKKHQFIYVYHKIFCLYKIKCILDGSRLYPELNPVVGRPFKLVCDTETTITSTVTIRLPNGVPAGYCDPPTDTVLVDCAGSSGYSSALNDMVTTVTISASSLASNVNGTWTCSYLADPASYILPAPIRGTFSIHCS
jgi:hypothetical protein